MVPPDNRCCFCLNLQIGTIVIGVGNCLLYLCLLIGYLVSPQLTVYDDRINLTNLDVSVFVIFSVEILVSIILVYGAVKKVPRLTVPWFFFNALLAVVCLVGLGVTLFFGTNKMELNYSEYVTSMVILGAVAGVNFFCSIVIFQFRYNIIIERQIEISSQFEEPSCPLAPINPPPPSYDDVEETLNKRDELDSSKISPNAPPKEDGPPEYEAAMALIEKEKT